MLSREEILKKIDEKYTSIGQNPDVHLSGLLYAKPMTYWDFAQVDALLSLQTQRTTEKDEMVFIMYHQINELLFKMILWEIEQVGHCEDITPKKFSMHLGRISRYFDMLSSSFDIMKDGMEIEQFMKFRDTLTPASGFQSAQYRKVEIASTDLLNIIDYRDRASINRDTPYEHAFDHLYWRAAGFNRETGELSTLLTFFEEKYKKELVDFMKEYNTLNLLAKYKSLPEDYQHDLELVNAMRHYDYTVNVSWVMHHFEAAKHYIESGQGSGEATGGSDWKKYMLPQYQRRIFFPELWTDDELKNWGINNLDAYKTITNIDELLTNNTFQGWQK